MRRALLGHLWTVGPHLAHLVRPTRGPPDAPWDATVLDARRGSVRLTGWVRHAAGADTVLVLVHGLGGSADARYVLRMARACEAAGVSYLRLNLRGADRGGEDVYHAGSSDDLRAALASDALARYARVALVGFSMGGHVALRWAMEPGRDPRVRAVVAVCSPLDLAYGAAAIQRPGGRPYQRAVLDGLKEMYRAAARRGNAGLPYEEVHALRTIMAWDDAVVVPRFGFESRAEYYRLTSAGPRLAEVGVPALYVAAEADPVVTAGQVRPWLDAAGDAVEVWWSRRGGHVAFPSDLDVGRGRTDPLEPQLLRWIGER